MRMRKRLPRRWPGFSLLLCRPDLQHADAVAVELADARLARPAGTDTHCRVTAWRSLSPAVPTSPGCDAEPLGDVRAKNSGAHAALLDPEVEEIAVAARLVGRHLLDLEVFVATRMRPPHPGNSGVNSGGRGGVVS